MKVDLNNSNLAMNGGTPIRSKSWIDNFTTGDEEKLAVARVMDSKYLSLFEGSHTPDKPFAFKGGPEVQCLEDEWCDYYHMKYSISMNSATSGLFAAIGALGIGYGDEVIVSPYTMTACALAPMIYGAIPVFADVELDTGCLDPQSIEDNITKKTKAILVVHQFGLPANMEKIMALAKLHNIFVIEDCAQAHGARFNDKFVGTFGHIGVFSLNVNKTIQSGEGCICVTNDEELCYRLQLIRNHGEAVVGPANYEKITNIAGYNYRLSELHAAIIREQLKKLKSLNDLRIEMVMKLADFLKGIDFLEPLISRKDCKICDCDEKMNCEPTFYIFPMRFLPHKTNVKRYQFIESVNCEGIQFYQGYTKPLYLQPLYQRKHLFKYGYPFSAKENKKLIMKYGKGTCPNAEELYYNQMVINEHIRPPQKLEDVDDIINAVKKVCRI